MRRGTQTAKQIAEAIPNRTAGAIAKRVGELRKRHPDLRVDLEVNSKSLWTDEEDKRLLAMRQKGMTTKQLYEAFPDRSPNACDSRVRGKLLKSYPELRKRVNSIIVQRQNWTAAQEQLLISLYQKGRTLEQVQ